MNILIVIPARYDSSRFPGKPLIDINGKSLIERVWRQCNLAVSSSNIIVATDDIRIYNHCIEKNIQVVMTSKSCLTGTDRVYEAIKYKNNLDCIINVQGDEPLVSPDDIYKIARSFENNPTLVHCGMCSVDEESEFRNPNLPKVVCDISGKLLYISRCAIPSDKNLSFHFAKRQVCIYAFSFQHLNTFAKCANKTPIEQIEDIEILRFLELGIQVQMVDVSNSSIAIDVPQDVEKAINKLCLQ